MYQINYNSILKINFIFILFINSLFAKNIENVSVQLLWKHQFEFAGFYMAKEKGFYKENNLSVTLKEYQFGTNITKDVQSGKSTFGIGYSNLILDRSNNKEIVLLNAIFQSSPHILVTLKSSGIKSIKDFKNKKLMMDDDSINTAPLLSMLYSQGITLKDITLVEPSYDINDLVTKKADIFSSYLSNEIYELDKKGIKYNIWNPKDYGFDFYNDILFTSSNLLKNNPSQVNRFQNATLKGWKYAFNHIDETIELILKKYNTQNKTKDRLKYEADVLKKLAYKNNIPFGDICKTKIERIYDIYNIIGLAHNKIDYDNFIYHNLAKGNIDLTEKERKYIKRKKIVNICIDPNWMPFEMIANHKHIGMSADYFKIFEEKSNLKFNLIETKTWTQSLQFVKNRKCDLLPLAMSSKEREKYMNFTTPYLNIPLVLATKTKVNFIDNMANLKNKTVCMPKNYAYLPILKKRYPNLDIVEVEDINDGLKRVSSGEYFGYIGTLATIGYNLQKNFIHELKIAGKFDEKWQLSVAVRSDDKILFNIIQKSINNLDPKLQQKILNNWVSVKYENGIDYKLIWNILIIVSIIIIFFLYRSYILNRSNQKLQYIVDLKTKDLQELNETLEQKIENEVAKNMKIQEQLFKSEKMAAMGEMIGNIAHQWRQPLSVISTSATGLLVEQEYGLLTDESLIKSCTSINNNVQYLSKTIDDFKNFIKGDRKKAKFILTNTMDSFLKLIEGSVNNNHITIITDVKDITIDSYENELIQCFMNLYNNAKDVLKELPEEDRLLFISTSKIDNNIQIIFKDTGGGIPQNIINKIFEPYFTTKEKNEGTGLGLHMTHKLIVDGLNGTITATNTEFSYNEKEYKGAKFIIELDANI